MGDDEEREGRGRDREVKKKRKGRMEEQQKFKGKWQERNLTQVIILEEIGITSPHTANSYSVHSILVKVLTSI